MRRSYTEYLTQPDINDKFNHEIIIILFFCGINAENYRHIIVIRFNGGERESNYVLPAGACRLLCIHNM